MEGPTLCHGCFSNCEDESVLTDLCSLHSIKSELYKINCRTYHTMAIIPQPALTDSCSSCDHRGWCYGILFLGMKRSTAEALDLHSLIPSTSQSFSFSLINCQMTPQHTESLHGVTILQVAYGFCSPRLGPVLLWSVPDTFVSVVLGTVIIQFNDF